MENNLILSKDDKAKKFVAVLNKKIDIPKLFNGLGHCTAGMISMCENNDICLLNYEMSDCNEKALISHYGFIILKADNSNQIRNLRQKCNELGIINNYFIQTMSQGGSLEEIKNTKNLKDEEHEYFCLTMFGDSSVINSLTKKISLFK